MGSSITYVLEEEACMDPEERYRNKFSAYQIPGVDEALFFDKKEKVEPVGWWKHFFQRWKKK